MTWPSVVRRSILGTLDDIPPFDVRKALARLDQLQADADNERQAMTLAPSQIIIVAVGASAGLMTAGAALFAAGMAFVKSRFG